MVNNPLQTGPQQYNPQIPPPYFHHYPPTNNPSVDNNESLLARIFHRQMDMAERQEKHDQEREEREKCKEECEKHEKREANQRVRINKAFEKIEHFDGSNPNRCLPWLEQIHVMSNMTTETIVRNCSSTVEAALPRQSTTSMLMSHQNK